jgi:hypothetical protein
VIIPVIVQRPRELLLMLSQMLLNAIRDRIRIAYNWIQFWMRVRSKDTMINRGGVINIHNLP